MSISTYPDVARGTEVFSRTHWGRYSSGVWSLRKDLRTLSQCTISDLDGDTPVNDNGTTTLRTDWTCKHYVVARLWRTLDSVPPSLAVQRGFCLATLAGRLGSFLHSGGWWPWVRQRFLCREHSWRDGHSGDRCRDLDWCRWLSCPAEKRQHRALGGAWGGQW